MGHTDCLPESINPKSWPRPRREQPVRHRERQQRDVSTKTAGPKQDVEQITALAAEQVVTETDSGVISTSGSCPQIFQLS